MRFAICELAFMAGFLLFPCRAAGMGNLINPGGGGELIFRGENSGEMRLSSRFLRVLRSKTGKDQPGAAPEHLELAAFGF